MIHLYRHTKGKLKGKFDIAFVKKGNVIFFSNQGYENKDDVISVIRGIKNTFSVFGTYYQDDTTLVPVVMWLRGKAKPYALKNKPNKKYQP